MKIGIEQHYSKLFSMAMVLIVIIMNILNSAELNCREKAGDAFPSRISNPRQSLAFPTERKRLG